MPDPPGASSGAVEPTPAATVVPLRDGPSGLEVLMLRRDSRGQFGGMWVFPGGQVDEADLPLHPAAGDEIAAARQAAVREAHEEAGISLDPERLVVLSFWLPPPGVPRRFATWFFLSDAAHATEVVVDDAEIRDHRWMGPGEAMAQREEGEMELAPPTFMTLWWLDRHTRVEGALTSARARAPERFESHISAATGGGLTRILWAGDAGYEDGDVDRPGARRRMILDPDGWRVEMSAGA